MGFLSGLKRLGRGILRGVKSGGKGVLRVGRNVVDRAKQVLNIIDKAKQIPIVGDLVREAEENVPFARQIRQGVNIADSGLGVGEAVLDGDASRAVRQAQRAGEGIVNFQGARRRR